MISYFCSIFVTRRIFSFFSDMISVNVLLSSMFVLSVFACTVFASRHIFMVCLILRMTRSRLGYGEILFYSLSNASLRVVSSEVPYLQVNPRKSYCNEVRG